MATSSLSLRTTNTVITQASIEWRTTSTIRPKILEISLIQAAATAGSFGLGRPAAIGVMPVNTLFQTDDPGDPGSVMNGATAWNTSPTAPTVYYRRWNSVNVIGVGVVWTFPRGIIIPVSSSVVVFNITAVAASDINCVCDE